MKEMLFAPTPEMFGVFQKYIDDKYVTDIDYNGDDLWITSYEKGRYKVKEEITEEFVNSFTHNISNCVNEDFNDTRNTLEAYTDGLRISILHDSIISRRTSICIRKSPAEVRNTVSSMIENGYCSTEILQLLINCVRAKMNFVFGGEPAAGKTECAKFFMQFIPANERVITIEDSYELHYRDIRPDADGVELKVTPLFSYTDAIKKSLRQHPSWIMLSEARSVEVTSLLEQWSTGLNGFTTIHLDDLRKLPDRILNMMNDVNDAARFENRVYRYVNVGILIRCIKLEDGTLKRYIDQLCFFTRENKKNSVYMIVEDGEIVSNDVPTDIRKKMQRVGINDPFKCADLKKLLKEEQ